MLAKITRTTIHVILIQCGSLTLYACTFIVGGLNKRFKKTEAVFVGKYVNVLPEHETEIQNNKSSLLIFEVIKSWKGIHKEFVGIDLVDFPESGGTCPILDRFDEDAEYLVFAYGKSLKIEVECSDTRPLKASYNETQKEISKLNSSWFLFRSRVWPF